MNIVIVEELYDDDRKEYLMHVNEKEGTEINEEEQGS